MAVGSMAKRLVVMCSERGSNFSAIAAAVQSGVLPHCQVVGLITPNPKAQVLERAKQLEVPSFIVDRKDDPSSYEVRLQQQIEELNPDFICLAGYMKIIGNRLLERWPRQILNIHPSLLPAFRGLHAQRQALESGVKQTGCTVHFVNAELDGGPIVLQTPCEILPGDTEATLSERLLPIEHVTYVQALKKLVTRPYQIVGGRVIFS